MTSLVLEQTASATEPECVDILQLASQWARIKGRLQREAGEVEYRTWLRQITLASRDGDEITVTLPTRFLCDWVASHYGSRLTALWRQKIPRSAGSTFA